jgi:hypothetical protein
MREHMNFNGADIFKFHANSKNDIPWSCINAAVTACKGFSLILANNY